MIMSSAGSPRLTLEDELVGLERARVEERVSADDEDDGSHNQSVPSGIRLES